MENEIVKASVSVIQEGLQPVMNLKAAEKRRDELNEFIRSSLKEGKHYGIIKGCKLPSLYKAGAEKLATLFGLSPKFRLLDSTEDWTGEKTGGEPFLNYRYRCELWQGPAFIADSEGSCNSWEKKYRYRKDYQSRKTILNDDVAGLANTLQKMGQKRALIAAVLIGVGISDFYTQDIEDMPPETRKPGNDYGDRQDRPASKPQARNGMQPLGDRDLWNPIIRSYKLMLAEPYESHLATILEDGRLAKDSHKFYESVFYNQEKKKCLVYSETDLLKMTEHLFQKRLGVEWLEKKAESADAYIANENTSPDEPH